MVDLIPILRMEINSNQPTKEIRALALDQIGRIDKKAFIATFAKVFEQAFSKANITAGFRATGLVPNDPLVVLSKLDVKVRTPTPPLLGQLQWNPKTPTNANEIQAQSTLLRDRILSQAKRCREPKLCY
jgi:hypothetical protein